MRTRPPTGSWVLLALLSHLLGCSGSTPDDDDITPSTDQDGDGFSSPADCNDDNAAVFPGAPEFCNLRDDDCDSVVDNDAEDAPTWYGDVDEDGYGNANYTTTACTVPSGYVGQSGDCNELDPSIHPGVTDKCDGVDNNCNGIVDEDTCGETPSPPYTQDEDQDGYGVEVDCNDLDSDIHPGATEVCNGRDDNCDGESDEDVCEGTPPPSGDADGDGFPEGEDCNDRDTSIFPGADELCNGRDDNCDGEIDEGVCEPSPTPEVTPGPTPGDSPTPGDTPTPDETPDDASVPPDETPSPTPEPTPVYPDSDLDGFTADVDCDDLDPDINPDAIEISDGIDNDCDGRNDEDFACTVSGPSDSIQDALEDARNGDIILVCPGTYVEALDFGGTDVVLVSRDGPATTIIDGGGESPVVTFADNESNRAALRGFTIRGGDGRPDTNTYLVAGIFIKGSDPVIESNIIRDHIDGPAVSVEGGADPLFRHNEIAYNQGPALSIDSSAGLFQNNLVHDNSPRVANPCEQSVSAYSSTSIISNNTISNNYAGTSSNCYCVRMVDTSMINNILGTCKGGAAVAIYQTSSLTFAYNDVWNTAGPTYSVEVSGLNYLNLNNQRGNLSVDPLFRSVTGRDFKLQAGSPVIDKGDPDPFYADPDGSRADMGAFGGPGGDWQPLLSLPTPEGDADGDGVSSTQGDCDDTSPDIFPGHAEISDGLDNDCDGRNDEDFACTVSGPSDSIQDALEDARNGDIILVCPGTYVEALDFGGTDVVLVSRDGPTTTIIDGGGESPVVTFADNESDRAALRGFTIRGGDGHPDSSTYLVAGIFIKGSDPVIESNIIRDHIDGPAVSVEGGANPLFRHNEIAYNQGAALSIDSSAGTFQNNLIHDNSSRAGGGCEQSLSANYSTSIIANNTISNNSVFTASNCYCVRVVDTSMFNNILGTCYGGAAVAIYQTSPLTFAYNNVWNTAGPAYSVEVSSSNYLNLNNQRGNLSVDPLFRSVTGRDFKLQAGSPVIDRGDPDPFYADPDGSRADMGAFGGPGGNWQPLPSLPTPEEDADGDGVSSTQGDCDDTSPDIFPGHAEISDGLDNDCDGRNDEDFACTVAGPSDSIQDALEDARNGDIILVCPGTYVEALDFGGTDVVLVSRDGPATTIIDGGGESPVVTFADNESDRAALRGFTIRGGDGHPDSSSYLVAGIFIKGSDPVIESNIIRDHIDGPAVSVEGGANPLFRHNEIAYNQGSALSIDSSAGIFQNNLIHDNSPRVGATCEQSLSANYSTSIISNNTISNNYAGTSSSCYCVRIVDTSMFNNILGTCKGGAAVAIYQTSPLTFAYNNVWNTTGPAYSVEVSSSNYLNLNNQRGNLSVDPLFVSVTWRDFRLQAGSPVIDKGDPDPFYADPDGSPGDMGAFGGPGGDWQPLTSLPTPEEDADGDGISAAQGDCDDSSPDIFPGHAEISDGLDNDCDGRNDEDFACTVTGPSDSIQDALEDARNGDIILVCPGTYVETLDFGGTDVVLVSRDGPATTIIDGGGESPVVTFADNESDRAALRGFTIRGGNGHPDSSTNLVAGILIHGADPVIESNIIRDHVNANQGVVVVENGANPLLRHNELTDNAGYTLISVQSGGVFENNLLHHNKPASGATCATTLTLSTSTTRVINNTVTHNEKGTASGCVCVGIYAGTVVNNIFAVCSSGPAVAVQNSPDLTFTYNNVWNTAGPGYSTEVSNSNYLNLTNQRGNLSVDPLFVSATWRDFGLQAGSPVIDKGDPDPIFVDPDGSRADMGAFGGAGGTWPPG